MQILFRTYNFCVYTIVKAPADINFATLQKGIRAFKNYYANAIAECETFIPTFKRLRNCKF